MGAIVRLDCPLTPLSRGPLSHFFGYYDKSPWSGDGAQSRLLAHRTARHFSMPPSGEPVELGLLDGAGGFENLTESVAWNFQQGAMLQWMPGRADVILFNDMVEGEARGITLDLASGHRTAHPCAFAAVSPNGREALGIDFRRLTALKPEYGYAGLAGQFGGERCPEDDGIWQFDLAGGQPRLLLSLRQIAETGGGAGEAMHYVNHLDYSRTGRRFSFLHRSVNAVEMEHTRLLCCNADGSGLRLLIAGLATHVGWRDDTSVLAWAGERRLMRAATGGGRLSRLPVGGWLRALYRRLGKPAAFKARLLGDGYRLFDTETGRMETIGQGVLASDGHCSFSPDGAWVVTDTYPDRHGCARLLLVRWRDRAVFEVARFFMPSDLDGAVRCDLHPRWHPAGTSIAVDVADRGGRQMLAVDVSALTSPS